MKHLNFGILLMTLSFSSFCQKERGIIELNPYLRYDGYSEFLATERPLSSNYVTLKGVSYGINVNYKAPISNDYKLLIGLGYYKNTFNKIRRRNTTYPGQANDREILFLSPLLIPFFTDKYWYNTLAFDIGAARTFILNPDYLINVGVSVNNFFTFSQYYHLTNNPEGSRDYRKKQFRYLGLSTITQVGLQKRINKIYFGPNLIIPLYDILKTDETFPNENKSASRNKWLRGVGFGLSFNFLLTKKNNL